MDIARILTTFGARCDRKADSGETPLHMAAQSGSPGLVAFLLREGCQVNAEDDDGKTALWNAALQGNFEVVRLLLREGANVSISSLGTGSSPLMVATQVNTLGRSV